MRLDRINDRAGTINLNVVTVPFAMRIPADIANLSLQMKSLSENRTAEQAGEPMRLSKRAATHCQLGMFRVQRGARRQCREMIEAKAASE